MFRSFVLDYRFVRLFRLLDECERISAYLVRGYALSDIYAMRSERFPIFGKYITLETTKEAYKATPEIFKTSGDIPGYHHLSYFGKRLFETRGSVSLTGNVEDSLMLFNMGEVFVDIGTHPIKTIPVSVPEDVEKSYRGVHGTSLIPQKVLFISEVDVKAFKVSLPVKPIYLDINNHVHYSFYALLFLEVLRIACVEGHLLESQYHPKYIEIKKLAILYENDIKLGDVMHFWLWNKFTNVLLCKTKRESDNMAMLSIQCELWPSNRSEVNPRLWYYVNPSSAKHNYNSF